MLKNTSLSILSIFLILAPLVNASKTMRSYQEWDAYANQIQDFPSGTQSNCCCQLPSVLSKLFAQLKTIPIEDLETAGCQFAMEHTDVVNGKLHHQYIKAIEYKESSRHTITEGESYLDDLIDKTLISHECHSDIEKSTKALPEIFQVVVFYNTHLGSRIKNRKYPALQRQIYQSGSAFQSH
ncbi:MAG: hypothetical protein OXE99_11505 [Cellvibrionales bacterium]|nr:hypothetical protein [Cellvibrionales bacterium]